MAPGDDRIAGFVAGVAFATLVLVLGRFMDLEIARHRALIVTGWDLSTVGPCCECDCVGPCRRSASPGPALHPRLHSAPSEASSEDGWERGSAAGPASG